MTEKNLSRRKAISRIGALALGAYAAPSFTTLSVARASGGSAGSSNSGRSAASASSGSSGSSASSGSSTSSASSGCSSPSNGEECQNET